MRFYPFLPHQVFVYWIFKSVLGNDFGKSTEERGSKIDTVIVLHDEQNGNFEAVGLALLSGASLSDSTELQRR